MADRELNIRLSAIDTATATIKQLQAEVRQLEVTFRNLAERGAETNNTVMTQLRNEITGIREAITARQQQAAATDQSAAAAVRAAQAQVAASTAAEEALRQQIALGEELAAQYNRLELQLGLIWPDQERQISSAAASGRTFAESLSAMAAQDAAVRDEAYRTITALEMQQGVIEKGAVTAMTGAAFFERYAASMGMMNASLKGGITGEAFMALPELGSAVQLTQATGFSQMVADLAGVKQSLLDATEAGKLFEAELDRIAQAEHVAFQQQAMMAEDAFAATMKGRHFGEMEMMGPAIPRDFIKQQIDDLNDAVGAEAQFAAAMERSKGAFEDIGAGSEKAGRSVSGLGNIFQRETRHIVGFFDAVSRGQWGQAMSSIGSGLRDLGVSAVGMATSIGGLIAIMGVEHILRAAAATARWAQAQQDAAAAAGMSLENYSQLAGALTLTGMKSDEADAQLRKLANTLSSAMHNAASKQADAFHVLHISQEQLAASGGDVDKVLRLLADAYNSSGDSAAKSAAFTEILGRDWEKLIPLLEQGSQGMETLEQRAKELGITISEDDAKNLRDMNTALTTLSDTFRGEGTQSIIAWSGTIKLLAEDLTGLIRVIGEVVTALGQIVGAAEDALNWIDRVTAKITGTAQAAVSLKQNLIESFMQSAGLGGLIPLERMAFGPDAEAQATAEEHPARPVPHVQTSRFAVEEMAKQVQSLQEMRDAEDAAAEAADRHAKTVNEALQLETKARIEVIKATLAAGKLTDPTDVAAAKKELNEKEIQLLHETLSANESASKSAARAAKQAAHQAYEDFAAAEKLKIAEADGDTKKIIAIYEDWAQKAKDVFQQHANVIEGIEKQEIQAINTARLAAIKASAAEEEKRTHLLMLNAQLQSMAAGTYKYPGQEQESPQADIQRSQQYIAEAQQVQQAADAEIKALEQVAATADAGSKTQIEAQNEIMDKLIQSKEKEVELYRQAGEAAVAAAKKAAAPFEEFFDSLGSQLNQFASSMLKSFLDPQTTIIKIGLTSIKEQQNQVKQAFRQLFMGVAQDLANTLEKALSHAIASALSGGAANTIGELLGNLFSKVFSNVAGQAASSVTGAATQTAPIVSAITAGATTTGTAIATAATTQVSAVTAGSASIVGAITAMSAAEIPLLSAIAFKPTIAGFSYQSGGVVHAPTGLGAQLAILHHREMVLPPHISEGFQNMFRGGDQSANLNYSPVINMGRGRGGTGMTRSEFGSMLNMHSGALLGEARNMMRGGWRP